MKTTGKARKYIYAVTLFFITLTGFAQMPVFKRYYIADIPGLGWLAQFYVTHFMHYLAAIVFITFAFYIFLDFILNRSGSGRITGSGYFKIAILAGLTGSGALMVIKNLSGVYFGPITIIVLDLAHLGLCMMLLSVSFYTLILKKKWVS